MVSCAVADVVWLWPAIGLAKQQASKSAFHACATKLRLPTIRSEPSCPIAFADFGPGCIPVVLLCFQISWVLTWGTKVHCPSRRFYAAACNTQQYFSHLFGQMPLKSWVWGDNYLSLA